MRDSRASRRRRALHGPVGLALGGGGARGIAHVGILEELSLYERFQPAIVAGTSVGSVVAVLYAAGLPIQRIHELAVGLEWFSHVIRVSDMIDLRAPNRAGLFPNTRLGDFINEQLDGRSFDELPRDVAVIATDIENRRRVIMTSHRVARSIDRAELTRFLPTETDRLPGAETIVISDMDDVGLAVRASSAVPGVFRPVPVHTMKLVDGGIVDQTPVSVVRAMGARFSIGVSLALSFMPPRLATFAHAISGTIGMLGLQQLRKSLELADIGFQISGIDERSPVRPHQVDLIEIARSDMRRELKERFGADWIARNRRS
jgi:NTE family protein